LRARFFDEHVFMEKLCGLRAHEARCQLRRRRLMDRAREFRDPLPVAIIVEKSAALACLNQIRGERTRIAHVAVDTGGDDVNPVSENSAEASRAIPAEGLESV